MSEWNPDDPLSTGISAQGQLLREQFERERQQLGLASAPIEMPSGQPHDGLASVAPAPSSGVETELGAWLARLGAEKYESNFREQQFVTVEEVVEARCGQPYVSALHSELVLT